MRDHTLQLQALIENKKLHQFKAYDTLEQEFKYKFLQTYPSHNNEETLLLAADRLKELFLVTINRSQRHTMDEGLSLILR